MNNVLLQQAGGFPLETDTLDFMQVAYKSLQALAAIGAENYVLKGCVKNGVNVGDGFVVINGEVLEFRGGIETATIIIREEKAQRPFENGQVKDVFVTRYATFGNGVNEIAWNTIIRIKNLAAFKDLPAVTSNSINEDDENKLATAKAIKLLNDKIDALLPAKSILMWGGSIANIPAGYALCDGLDGRPDLRDKFVLGAGLNYPVGSVGGEKEHYLTINELPSHRFNLPFPGNKSDVYGAGIPSGRGVDGWEAYGPTNMQTDFLGGGLAHNNMPPYYTLAYIIKL